MFGPSKEGGLMTLFRGCQVVKCDDSGRPAENEVHVQYKVIELGTAQPAYEPDQPSAPERVFALLEKVR
jgi:hypothetical protein